MVEFLFLRKFFRQIGSSIPFLIFAIFAIFLKNPEQIIIVSFVCMALATLTFPFVLDKNKF